MRAKRTLRVLVLVEPTLVPPDDADPATAREADWKTEWDVVTTLRGLGHEVQVLGVGGELGGIRNAAWDFKPQLVFNLLEGFDALPGYDMNVVAYLELLGLPYTGCNSRGLFLARDKALAKKLLAWHRVPLPEFAVVPRGRAPGRAARLPYPLIVKSLTLDASVGIAQASVVDGEEKLRERVRWVHEKLGTDALVEQYVDGRELYVGLLGNGRVQTLPPWELDFGGTGARVATERLKSDPAYQLKHGVDSGPARDLPAGVAERVAALGRRVYRTLMLNGYARVDLRLADDGRLFVLEANPNPQVSRDEDLAQSALKAGLRYDALVQRIVELGLSWQPRRLG